MDDKKFTTIYLAVQPSLAAYAKRLTRHTERAEDLLQDANLKIWAKRSQYEEGNFLGWCKVVMRNHYYNQVEVESRMKFVDSTFANGSSADVLGYENDESSYEASMHFKYLAEQPNQEDYFLENQILEVIAELPPHTALLIQKKLQGMDYTQLAKVLGIKPNNAKQRYFNDIKLLRQKLQEKGLLDN